MNTRVRHPRLGLEALEPRCTCAAGVTPAAAAAFARPPAPPPALVADATPGKPSADSPGHMRVEPVLLHLRAGVPFSGRVGHVDGDDAVHGPDGDEMAATIDWGDGVKTAGTVRPVAGRGYDVVGAATYVAAGSYAVTLSVTAADGTQATAQGWAEVDSAAPAPTVESGQPSTPTPTPPAAEPPAGTPGSDSGVTQGASRPPADTSGAVVWVHLPDPRPVGPPPGERRNVLPSVNSSAFTAPPPGGWPTTSAGGGEPTAEAAAGPAYLAAAADSPTPAADLVPIDLRPAPPAAVVIDVVEPPADALAQADPPPANSDPAVTPTQVRNAPCAGECGGPSVAPAPPRRPTGGWWKSLSWCLALIFTERVLAARAAQRSAPRLPGRPTRLPPAPPVG